MAYTNRKFNWDLNKLKRFHGKYVKEDIIANGPAFDLSAYNNGTTYADLTAALTALNALPAAFKKPGMSFKFVSSVDNKYVQFRLMAQTFSTTVTDWQGIDDEPTAGSVSLANSGGVNKALNVIRKDLGGHLCSNTIHLNPSYNGNYLTLSLDELCLSPGDICTIHFKPSNSDTNTNIYYTIEGGRTAIEGSINSEVYYTDYKIPSDATGFQLYTGNVISALDVLFEVSYKGDVKKDISTIRNSYTYSLENSFTQDTANKIMFTDCLLKAGDICVLDVICDGTFKYHIYYTDINGNNAGGAIIVSQTTSGSFNFEIPENVYGFNVWAYRITGTANVKVGVRKVVLLNELDNAEKLADNLKDRIIHNGILTKNYNFRSDTNDLSLVLSDYNIKPGDEICIEAQCQGTFKYHLYFYNSSDENIRNIVANGQGDNVFTETVPANAYKFRVFLFNAVGNCTFTFNVRNITTFKDLTDIVSVSKQYSYLSVLRNLNRSAINPSTGLPFVTYKPLSMLVYSDIHYDMVRNNRILEFAKFAKDKELISDSLLCGDIAGGTWYDYSTDFSDAPGMNEVLKVIGNHDIVGDPTPTAQQIYNRYLDNIENWGVVQPDDAAENGLCYYYKDYSDSKIRLIVLDFSTLTANSAQLSWLEGVLEDAKQNELAVICTMHIPFNTTYELFNTSFNCIDFQPTGMTQNTSALTAVDAFIHNGGEFVCWLFGHIHTDWIGKYTIEDRNQVFISLGAAMINLGHWEDCARVEGTESEDSFSLISFDTDKKTISLYRVGAHYDRYMRHKEMLTINYGNSSLIASY